MTPTSWSYDVPEPEWRPEGRAARAAWAVMRAASAARYAAYGAYCRAARHPPLGRLRFHVPFYLLDVAASGLLRPLVFPESAVHDGP